MGQFVGRGNMKTAGITVTKAGTKLSKNAVAIERFSKRCF